MSNVDVDWEKVNEEKNLHIILGRSENQALELMIKNSTLFDDSKYKETVRKFFKLNCELDQELLGFNPGEQVQEQTIKDSKSKRCIGCNAEIPLTWKFHAKCGWKE